MANWRIYYEDGSTYGDEDGAVEDAPGLGVVLIVCADPEVGRVILGGETAYGWHDDRGEEPPWDQHDTFGVMDYLARPGWRKLVFGRSVSDVRYRELYEAAMADPEFEPKSAKRWQAPNGGVREATEPRGR